MYNDVINLLISESISTNEAGETNRIIASREVFVEVKSVGQSEFYQANAQGFKPEFVFLLPDYYEYNNEKEIEYNGERYKVLRTSRVGDGIKIVCYGGVNIASS